MSATISPEDVEGYVALAKSLDHTQLIYAGITLLFGLVIVRIIIALIQKRIDQKDVARQRSTSMIKLIVRFVLDFIVVMLAANVAGIPLTSFVAVFSVIGIALSLALQDILANLAGGIIIMATNPFEVGHFVEYNGISGTVQDISAMHTRLGAADGRVIFVPNKNLTTSQVINYSMSPQRRIELTVSASYASSPEAVREAVLDALSHVEAVAKTPAPIVHLESYGDSAILYSIFCWCDAAVFWATKYEVNEALYDAFARKGVTMTYPHLNVHMISDENKGE